MTLTRKCESEVEGKQFLNSAPQIRDVEAFSMKFCKRLVEHSNMGSVDCCSNAVGQLARPITHYRTSKTNRHVTFIVVTRLIHNSAVR